MVHSIDTNPYYRECGDIMVHVTRAVHPGVDMHPHLDTLPLNPLDKCVSYNSRGAELKKRPGSAFAIGSAGYVNEI